MTLIWGSAAFADSCEKKLVELNKQVSAPHKLDPHVAFQVTAAANRISNSSLWKMEPQILKIQDNVNKSEFKHSNKNLTVFYNDQAEVFGYIQKVKNKNTFWCMKDK